MNEFTNFIHRTDIFFEGFKTPEKYLFFGDVDWVFNMDNVSSNLLVFRKPIDATLLNKIIDNYSQKEDCFSVITTVEDDKYCVLMTFTNSQDGNCLNHLVNIDGAIQLLDDATSTNDCLRAFENLYEDLECGKISKDDYESIKTFLKSQLTESGKVYAEQNHNI